MRRREFLPAASAVAATFSNPAGAAETRPPRPNVLFILPDQWRPQTLPAAGDKDLVAPALKRLSAEGTAFTRCYVTNPVCSPSRATLITGRYPHACRMPRNGLQLPLDQPSIAAQLKSAGYRTGYIGKWHLDGDARPGFVPPGERRRGFDYWAAFNRGHFYYKSEYYRDAPDPIRPAGYEPDYQTDLAIDFIKQNRTSPFYLFLSWGPPHTPRTPPSRARRYDPGQFRPAPNVPFAYEETARKNMAAYYGLCSSLDDNLGRLLATLDELKLADNTLVVFNSDHGDMLGAQGLEFKGVPFDESARVPLIMRWPAGGLRRGVLEDALISNADLMPSLLALCGAEIPGAVQGRNHAELMRTGEGDRAESIYSYGQLGTPGEWRMVVRGLDKLVVNTKGETTHLYNLGQDPFEMRNLATETGTPARTRDELKAHLRAWVKRVGDGVDPSSGLKVR
ncbi:MAG: sulfatase [Acidobacteria bacterium]|nr:sulfatase [Acidobacteriota bacterium]